MSEKKSAFLWFARYWSASRLRKQFAAVRVAGLESLQQELTKGPLLLTPNHVAWWDPFLLVALDEALGGGGLYYMDAENLRRYFFFRWAGALPLRRGQARVSAQDLLSGVESLKQGGRYLVLFPQGEQRPAHLPLEFHRGALWLSEKAGVPVVPVGVRYDFLEGPQPVVHVSLGSPCRGDSSRSGVRVWEEAVQRELQKIDRELLLLLELQRSLPSGVPAFSLPGRSSAYVDILQKRGPRLLSGRETT